MKDLLDEINKQIEAFQTNATSQLEKGNNAAGGRARKASLQLTKLFKEFRKESLKA